MKCEIISILSGKGGAGKTSIAVNVAHFMASAGIKVLLVDCDLSTNGSTLFFGIKENKQIDFDKHLVFDKLLYELLSLRNEANNANINDILKKSKTYIEYKFDFISSADPTNREEISINREKLEEKQENIFAVIEGWRKEYEVIIFDHAAGYSDLTDFLINVSTRAVMVLDPNPVSTGAIRRVYKRAFRPDIQIVCCLNKLRKDTYARLIKLDPATYNQVNCIIPQCIGFELNETNAKLIESGEFIPFTRQENITPQVRMAKLFFPGFKDEIMQYINGSTEIVRSMGKSAPKHHLFAFLNPIWTFFKEVRADAERGYDEDDIVEDDEFGDDVTISSESKDKSIGEINNAV